MRDSVAPYAVERAGVAVDALAGAAPAMGIVQSATSSMPAAAKTTFETCIHVISRDQSDRSSALRIRRGSSVVRLAVKTLSHLALLYKSSESEGRFIVPIHPSPVRRSTLPLRRRTGISRPSIWVFTG